MAKASKPTVPESFETALTELETLISTMENGQLTLEASLTAYQRGAELLKFCQGKLADTQQQVRILENDTLKLFETDDAN